MTMRNDGLPGQVLHFCRRWDMLPAGGLLLCAVSGGRDSMALLHLLSRLAKEEGFQIAAAHFNHHLRSTADRDEAFVRDWCTQRGITLAAGAGDVRDLARREGLSLEDAARRMRYEFLGNAARELNAVRIATAHHREDNAETLLLHLIRGAGMQGLGGIAPVRGKIVRPLLQTGRGDIEQYISENHILFVDDETNQDTTFTRNRLRLEVLPQLEAMAPGASKRIAAAAELLREENEHLRREAEALLPGAEDGAVILPVPVLNQQDAVLRRRLVRGMGRKLGAELTSEQTKAVLSLKSGGYLDLPESLCAVRRPHQLILKKQPLSLPPLALREGTQVWGPWTITLERHTAPVESASDRVVLRDAGGALSAAAWDGTGRLAVENGSRTIKRLFADAGIPIERRGEHPAVLLEETPVAILGVAVDWKLRPETGEACLTVIFRRSEEGRTP